MCITECFTSLYLSSSLVKNPKRQKQTNKPQKKTKTKKDHPQPTNNNLKKKSKQTNEQTISTYADL